MREGGIYRGVKEKDRKCDDRKREKVIIKEKEIMIIEV